MAKGTRWPSAHGNDLAALICRRWRGYQHRQELFPWLHPNNKALSWLGAATGQWPLPPPRRHILCTVRLWFGSRCVCAKIMVCFKLSRSQSRRFRPPGSSRSRWELNLRRDVSLKSRAAVIPSWQTFRSIFLVLVCVFVYLLKAPYYAKCPFTNVFQQQSGRKFVRKLGILDSHNGPWHLNDTFLRVLAPPSKATLHLSPPKDVEGTAVCQFCWRP